MMAAFLWQRYKDSNLNIRSQSPLCYRYTIPLYIYVVQFYAVYQIASQFDGVRKALPCSAKGF